MLLKKITSAIGKIICRLSSWITGAKQPNGERLQEEYFNIATFYYVAGRYAHFSFLMPTAGNLLHHAVEMYLKGYLCPYTDEGQRRKLGHSLKRIWRDFKRRVGDTVLDQYDATIKALDLFEGIRYPEKSAREGFEVHFSLIAPDPPSTGDYAMPASRRYDVVLNQVDHLVEAIFQKSGLNQRFFYNRLNEDARTFLKRDNPIATPIP